jgi:hypothetical protein
VIVLNISKECLHFQGFLAAWPWKSRHHDASKHVGLLTEPHSATFQKLWTVRGATMRTSDLTWLCFCLLF